MHSLVPSLPFSFPDDALPPRASYQRWKREPLLPEAIALNRADGDLGAGLAIALNFEVAAGAPEFVQLTPVGISFSGRDGRAWKQSRLDQVIALFRENGADLPIDLEHATHKLGENGQPAPAVGWIKKLEARGASLWGQVEWLDTGANAVASKAYRYLSPVFKFDPATGEVVRIVSAGLTNLPNLHLEALNRGQERISDPRSQATTQSTTQPQKDPIMDPAILAALGLSATATAVEAALAINKLKENADAGATAMNRVSSLEAQVATPDATKWVPRADHDLALNRVKDFEAEQAKLNEAAIVAAVDGAVAAGKVAPASKDYHLAACRQDGGLERFTAMVGGAPSLVGTAGQGVTAAPPAGQTQTALNAEERAVADALGHSHADFLKAKEA